MGRDVSKYVLDGAPLPSVTEVLDLAALTDLSRIPFDVLEFARERGSAVHDWVELLTNHPDSVRGMEPPEFIAPYIAAWEKWRVESRFEIERAEEAVIHSVYRYAGTYDVLGRIGGVRALPDYKARYGMSPETGPQTAAYVDALRDMGVIDKGEPVKRFTLLLRSDATYRFKEHTDRNDINVFRACVQVAHWKLSNRIESLEAKRRAA